MSCDLLGTFQINCLQNNVECKVLNGCLKTMRGIELNAGKIKPESAQC